LPAIKANFNFQYVDIVWHFINNNDTIQRFDWTFSSPYQESTIQKRIMSKNIKTNYKS